MLVLSHEDQAAAVLLNGSAYAFDFQPPDLPGSSQSIPSQPGSNQSGVNPPGSGARWALVFSSAARWPELQQGQVTLPAYSSVCLVCPT
jgi:hypothetical protein